MAVPNPVPGVRVVTRPDRRSYGLELLIAAVLLGFGLVLEQLGHPRLAYATVVLVLAVVLAVLRDLIQSGDR